MGQLDLTTAQVQSILGNAEFGMEFTGGLLVSRYQTAMHGKLVLVLILHRQT